LGTPEYATVEEASKPQTTVPVNEFDKKPDEEESDLFQMKHAIQVILNQ
jgi:hypothetical protein